MSEADANDPKVIQAIQDLIQVCGGSPTTFEGSLVTQMIQTALKLMIEGHDTGQLKLITNALKEIRYAYNIFNQYPKKRRISIFGSARTPEDHPDYLTAKSLSSSMAAHEWMCITGAANGIMKAGLEGPKAESSFGLSIRLPFEAPTNSLIHGDPKLITFRYFFTRKLMFVSHSDAVAAFPGGFGTLDELFEVLTLMQTGKASIIPVVLLEGKGGVYWKNWEEYIREHLLSNNWVSPEDRNFYHVAQSVEDAVQHIQKFYHRYHSSRYVKEELVIRLTKELTSDEVSQLNNKYSKLIASGSMRLSGPLDEEDDHLNLPRLVFCHTRRDYGLLRGLIDDINAF